MNKNKNIITPRILKKRCKNAFFIVYAGEEKMRYAVPKKYLSNYYFQRFIREYHEDIKIQDVKNLEFFVRSCPIWAFEYLLETTPEWPN